MTRIPGYDAWKTRSDIDQWYLDHPGEARAGDEPVEETELDMIYRELEDLTALHDRLKAACKPIVEAWDRANDPGMSDLDAEQPVSLMLTKADWQRLWFAVRDK